MKETNQNNNKTSKQKTWLPALFISLLIFLIVGTTGWWHTITELERANNMNLGYWPTISEKNIYSEAQMSFWCEGLISGFLAFFIYSMAAKMIGKRNIK